MTKKIKNLNLNFGPQHPAAHGVLRLILLFFFLLGEIGDLHKEYRRQRQMCIRDSLKHRVQQDVEGQNLNLNF